MKDKITVIGGAGFVGTNFCRELKRQQREFEILDLTPSVEFRQHSKLADVRDIESLRQSITGEIVINLAAVHRDDITDPMQYHTTNVLGAKNIVDICTEKNISKIIFTSSVAVYGFANPETDETGDINPFNNYGKTKHEAELIFRRWHEEKDGHLIIVRPTVIFGEGNRGNVYNLFNQIYSGRFLMIGSGNNKKSMAYVGNVAAFLVACVDVDQHFGIFNYVDTPDFSMNDLVLLTRKALLNKNNIGVRLPVWLGTFAGTLADSVSSFTNIKFPVSNIRVKKFISNSQFKSAKSELLGFEPPYTIFEGISRTLEHDFLKPKLDSQVFYTE